MNDPPNSRNFAPPRSGQPIVWITRSSGFATFQTSFTPSAHTCGLSPDETEPVERGARQMPLRPLGEDRHPRRDVRARLEVPELLALAPAPAVAGPHADDPAAVDEQLRRRRLRAGS